MSIHDPVADALTIVRNGSTAKKKFVELKFSNKIMDILSILKEEGYIRNFKKEDIKGKKFSRVVVELKYYENKPVIDTLKRISSPGLRVYTSVDTLPRVRNGYGVAIISTSKGVMTDKKARVEKIGGEVLCHVW